MLKLMRTILGSRAQIDRLTKLIRENKVRLRSIAITIEDMQGTLSTRQAGREDFEAWPEGSELEANPSHQLPPV
jgi:hypothetical protein